MNRFNAQDSTDSSVIEGAHCLLHKDERALVGVLTYIPLNNLCQTPKCKFSKIQKWTLLCVLQLRVSLQGQSSGKYQASANFLQRSDLMRSAIERAPRIGFCRFAKKRSLLQWSLKFGSEEHLWKELSSVRFGSTLTVLHLSSVPPPPLPKKRN